MLASTRSVSDRAWIAGLFGGALVLRLVHLLTVRHAPLFDHLYIDPKMYDEWAQRIAAGRLLSDAPFFLDPLYPYFVGAIYAVAGRSLLAVAAVQAVLGALAAPLVFDAARPWLPRPVPRVAGIAAALYLPAVFFGTVLMKPTLALFLVALMLWLLSRAMLAGRPVDWAVAGAALGVVGLARGTALGTVPALALAAALELRGDGRGRTLARVASFLAGVLVATIPTLAHNFAVSGELIPTTTNWGQIYFIGNNPDNANGRFMELPFVRSEPVHEQEDFKREAERRAGRTLTHREVSGFWFAESARWIRAHPGDWARLQWKKLRVFWGGYETPASLDYYFYRRSAPVLRLPIPGFEVLGPFALLGTLLALRRRGWPQLVAVYALALSISVVAFFVLTRFRLLAAPALYVLAALAAVELAGAVRAAIGGRARMRALALAALLLAAFAFVNLPVQAPRDYWTYRLADAIGLPTRLETTAKAHFNLGVTCAALADGAADPAATLRQAEQELRAALAEEERPETLVELGKVLAREGRDDDAIPVYEQALALAPYDWRARHTLGLLHLRGGRPREAEAAFAEALRLAPRHAANAVRLGEALLAQGRAGEAAEAFRYALRIDPDDRAARDGLARASGGGGGAAR